MALIYGSDPSPEMGLYPIVKASKGNSSFLSGRMDWGVQALTCREIYVCSEVGTWSDIWNYLSLRGKGLKAEKAKGSVAPGLHGALGAFFWDQPTNIKLSVWAWCGGVGSRSGNPGSDTGDFRKYPGNQMQRTATRVGRPSSASQAARPGAWVPIEVARYRTT